MYTIHEIAEICDVFVHTIRFYDKEGLMPFLKRNPTGNRQFGEDDLELIKLICCLKNSGMPVKEIKQYMDLCLQGEATALARREIKVKHRETILKQREALKKNLNIVDLKIGFYDAYLANPQAGYHPKTYLWANRPRSNS